MSEYLNLTAGGVDFLSLPAGKITRYPLEARDYRPFAQVQLALSPDALHVRLLAFEAEPPAGSMLLLALEGGIVLPFSADENGPVPAGQVRVERLRGEDLQGIYWGVHAMLPRAVLEERVGRVIRPGGVLRGNGGLPGRYTAVQIRRKDSRQQLREGDGQPCPRNPARGGEKQEQKE